jgi:hypothetical protein
VNTHSLAPAWRRASMRDASAPSGGQQLPTIEGVAAADNPWGVPLLDVRPVTLNMLSTSRDPTCAANAISFGNDDGLGFADKELPSTRIIPANLRFRVERLLADGALFLPSAMEDKWALYFHHGRILCIRSWMRQVQAVAEIRADNHCADVVSLRGVFVDENEEPAYSLRFLDYLLRSHALNLAYPAPLPAGLEATPQHAALWCMSNFGRRAQFTTPDLLVRDIPQRPLRTDSLLHIAVARGDTTAADAHLKRGLPVDLFDRSGLPPMHWALARPDTAMLQWLLERGSPIDVRSEEGVTPLMNAVQAGGIDKATFLLGRGADPNAADKRGFTALHRAAEMGLRELVELLLARHAAPHPSAQGHTPRSLAQHRGQTAIVELLDRVP